MKLLAILATARIFYINIMPAIVDGLKEGMASGPFFAAVTPSRVLDASEKR